MENPFIDLDINSKAQLSILEACRLNNPNIRIVFASTRQVYGRPQYLPVDEKHPLHPVDLNDINKMAGERYHLLYNEIYGIRSSVLRLTNTYGPRMRNKDARQTFLGVWIRNLLLGKSIQVFGDGKQRRDYNYIDDVIDALIIAASKESAIGEIYNLGAPNPLTLEETAKIMTAQTKDGCYEMVAFPKERKAIDIGDFICDYKNFQSSFGWEPKVGFTEGISFSIDYFECR